MRKNIPLLCSHSGHVNSVTFYVPLSVEYSTRFMTEIAGRRGLYTLGMSATFSDLFLIFSGIWPDHLHFWRAAVTLMTPTLSEVVSYLPLKLHMNTDMSNVKHAIFTNNIRSLFHFNVDLWSVFSAFSRRIPLNVAFFGTILSYEIVGWTTIK